MLAAPDGVRRAARAASSTAARGFVYSVGLLGVTGERAALAATATALAGRLLRITDKPVLVGVGVSNAEQAREACSVADGVVQGASVVRRLMEDGPDAVGDLRRRGARRDRLVKPVGRRAQRWRRSLRWSDQHRRAGRRYGDTAEPSRADDDTCRRAVGRSRDAAPGAHGGRSAWSASSSPSSASRRCSRSSRRRSTTPTRRPTSDTPTRSPTSACPRSSASRPCQTAPRSGRSERATGRDSSLSRRVGGQPPAAALRRRRPADLVRRGDRSCRTVACC